jgi:hypothetical protein
MGLDLLLLFPQTAAIVKIVEMAAASRYRKTETLKKRAPVSVTPSPPRASGACAQPDDLQSLRRRVARPVHVLVVCAIQPPLADL